MATNFEEAGDFLKQHWPLVALGGVSLVGLIVYFSASGSSGGAPASSYVAPGATTATNASYTAAQLQAQETELVTNASNATAIQMQEIASGAQVQQQAIQSNEDSYVSTVNAQRDLGQTIIAAAASQNDEAIQGLSTGFSNYVLGSAQETAAAASGAGQIAAANDASVGNVIGTTLMGAAALTASILAPGVGTAFGAGLGALVNSGNSGARIQSQLVVPLGNSSNNTIGGGGFPNLGTATILPISNQVNGPSPFTN